MPSQLIKYQILYDTEITLMYIFIMDKAIEPLKDIRIGSKLGL